MQSQDLDFSGSHLSLPTQDIRTFFEFKNFTESEVCQKSDFTERNASLRIVLSVMKGIPQVGRIS